MDRDIWYRGEDRNRAEEKGRSDREDWRRTYGSGERIERGRSRHGSIERSGGEDRRRVERERSGGEGRGG